MTKMKWWNLVGVGQVKTPGWESLVLSSDVKENDVCVLARWEYMGKKVLFLKLLVLWFFYPNLILGRGIFKMFTAFLVYKSITSLNLLLCIYFKYLCNSQTTLWGIVVLNFKMKGSDFWALAEKGNMEKALSFMVVDFFKWISYCE